METCRENCTVDCGACKGAGYSTSDSWAQAWVKFHAASPRVLAAWREQNGWWPMGHPNDERGN